jgi:hypothetical protein
MPLKRSRSDKVEKLPNGMQRMQALLSKEWVVVLLLVLFAFFLRLKGITNSPTDWHAFRQADTASVTREYVKHGIDLLHPHYQDLSNIQSGKDNLEGYRMVEFPFVNALVAWLVLHQSFFDLVVTSRLVSVAFSLGTLAAIYYLGKRWSGQLAGILSALTFAVLPYSRYYSRAILPEMPFIFFSTVSILYFDRWTKKGTFVDFFVSAFSLSLAMLLKPFVVFLIPLYVVLLLQRFKLNVWKHWELVVYGAIAVLPFLAWRKWIVNFPTGIPASDWLFNSDHIRFRPAWFRWLFFERFTKLILGWVGVIALGLGMWPDFLPKSSNVKLIILRALESSWLRYLSWWLGILIYFSVLATGNVRHDYYQVFVLPILTLTVGRGLALFIESKISHTTVILRVMIALTFLWASTQLAWNYVEGYYSTRPDWENAGRAIDKLVPADAKVIAPAFGDTSFLFQTNRTGWPIGFEIDKKIELGAQYYVSTAYDDEARQLEKEYQVMEKNPDYIIINLQKKNN